MMLFGIVRKDLDDLYKLYKFDNNDKEPDSLLDIIEYRDKEIFGISTPRECMRVAFKLSEARNKYNNTKKLTDIMRNFLLENIP